MATLENILNVIHSSSSYPHLVSRLIGLGITSYTVDVATRTTLYRQAQGNNIIDYSEAPVTAIAESFIAANVEAAIRRTQQGESDYAEFLNDIAQAGVRFYEATLAGSTKNVTYIGHTGCHIEPIPL